MSSTLALVGQPAKSKVRIQSKNGNISTLSLPETPYRNDPLLVQLCLEGNQAAWNELVSRYERLIYSIPRRNGYAEVDCEDILQNVFLAIYRRLGTLRDQRLLTAWIIRVTYRAMYHFRRSDPNALELDETFVDESEPPEDLVHRWELQHQMHQALERLEPKCRELLLAFLQENPPSYQEIAERVGCPVGSIGPTRSRCFKKLESILDEMGIALR